MLAKLNTADNDVIGTTVDTGCYVTEGYDPVLAIERLAGHLVHVHLRDVPGPHEEESVALGEGAVPVELCLSALRRLGYQDALSIEHNPSDHDPTTGIIASLDLVRAWLQRAPGQQ